MIKKPLSSYARKLDYVEACTLKVYDILKVKNTLVISAYCVTKHTICNFTNALRSKCLPIKLLASYVV